MFHLHHSTVNTHDCIARSNESSIVNFLDELTIIRNNGNSGDGNEADYVVKRYEDNILILNVSRTKELIEKNLLN